MDNKEIYIDGVDVSGCEHRCDTHKTLLADGHIMEFENYCQITNDGCYAINCYYKQLKRKEQECETLASQLDFEVQKKECLEQECEELKIYIESNEQQVKEVETLVMDNDRLINELDQLKEQLEAYKMEAEEGKEINAELKAENEELKKNYFTVI